METMKARLESVELCEYLHVSPFLLNKFDDTMDSRVMIFLQYADREMLGALYHLLFVALINFLIKMES